MTTREKLQKTLYDRLFWQTTERDDVIVTKHLCDHHEMVVVYALDDTTDELHMSMDGFNAYYRLKTPITCNGLAEFYWGFSINELCGSFYC